MTIIDQNTRYAGGESLYLLCAKPVSVINEGEKSATNKKDKLGEDDYLEIGFKAVSKELEESNPVPTKPVVDDPTKKEKDKADDPVVDPTGTDDNVNPFVDPTGSDDDEIYPVADPSGSDDGEIYPPKKPNIPDRYDPASTDFVDRSSGSTFNDGPFTKFTTSVDMLATKIKVKAVKFMKKISGQ